MVMMQSPVSDVPQPASPHSSAPNSPNNTNSSVNNNNKTINNNCNTNNNNNNTNNNNNNGSKISSNSMLESTFHKFEPIRLERPQPTKFDGLLLARFHEQNDMDSELIKNRPLIYPKELSELETNAAKFSIERLKQLTNHSINNRLSPSEDSNQSANGKYSHETSTMATTNTNTNPTTAILNNGDKYTNLSPNKSVEMDTNQMNNLHQNNHLNYHPFPLKYGPILGNPPTEMDLERFKLARSMTNGKDLSDFGFRIQLSGLKPTTNYARSDTSEELVVDENNELSSSQDTPTVCKINWVQVFSFFF